MTVAARTGIRVLAPEVAARIAAGEVIERPVSVVRELLDNAIDAGATRISVDVEDGGLGLLRVTDNGRGISPEDLEIAFERHATSKIGSLADLARVATLGFRGEALPSIAAAADVEIVSRAAGEPVGVGAVLVDARVVRRAARAAAQGTSLAVRDLFGRLPARRKFLASAAAEGRQVTVLVSHYALAYPRIAFQLSVNGRRTLTTSGNGDLRQAFAAVYGADAGEAMLTVDHEAAGVHVAGLAGPPALHRGTRAGISVFVNGRWVQSRALTFAIVDAYQAQLPAGRHPVATLAVSLDPDEIDVNVHPAKAEVRFRDERAVQRAVRLAVTHALEGSGVVAWEFRGPGSEFRGAGPEASRAGGPGGGPFASLALRERLMAAPGVALQGPQPVQERLAWQANGQRPTTPRSVLPLLRVVGQLNALYVVAEGPDGMYLIDQHAAHERVCYERILARRARGEGPAVQPLLEPQLAHLDPMTAAVLGEYEEQLGGLGFALEPFGEGAWLVRTVPAGLANADLAAGLRALLEKLGGERRVADRFDRAAATVACHTSVRAGASLAIEELRRLVEDLEAAEVPRTCPHGRPTLVHLSSGALARQFGRA